MSNKTKYSVEQKQEILLDLLLHFKKKNDETNQALVSTGESKYTSPFERVEVSDIKNYAFRESAGKGGWEIF